MRSSRPRRRTLVLGGARSGKSAFAEQLLADADEVLYAATAPRYEGDSDWSERIAQHVAQRPASWRTVEVGHAPERLAALLRAPDRTIMVDSLTLWLTAAMDSVDAWDDAAWRSGGARWALTSLTSELVDAFADAGSTTSVASSVVVVSDEVGFSLVPETAGARRFRDELGRLNQAFAAAADDVSLVVAGIPVQLKRG